MRKPNVHVAVVLALLVVLASASDALASTQDTSFRRQVQAGLRWFAHDQRPMGPFALPSRPVNQRNRAFTSRFRVAGSPYQWAMYVVRFGKFFLLEVGGIRHEPTDGEVVAQTHVWAFRLPLGDASIGPKLHHASIHTGTTLGPLGRIDLTFTSFRPRRAHRTHGCGPRSTNVDGYRRPGTLRGSLDLTFDEGSLPDLHVSEASATAIVGDLGETFCVQGTGHPAPVHPTCATQRVIQLEDDTRGFQAYGNTHDLELATFREQTDAYEYHLLEVDGPTHLVHVLPGGVAISSPHLPSVLSGSLTFDTTSSTSHTGKLCRFTQATGAWSAGTLHLHLDSGPIPLTGSGLHSKVRLQDPR